MKLDVVQKSDGNISIVSTWNDNIKGAIKAYHDRCSLIVNDDSYDVCWAAILNDQLEVFENFRERFTNSKPVIYTVMFNSHGGSEVESQSVESGQTVTEPEDPTKEGYVFTGWELNGYEYNFSAPVNQNMILVAAWGKEEPVSEPEEPLNE